jgi:DNA mismatch repair protein MutS
MRSPHIDMLSKLRQDEFSFATFDEPFGGTNPIEGAVAEYSVL